MANIALYPGGYKPPHIGHYKAAKQALKEGADKVIVFVGPKERDGITQNMSIALWKLYTQNDPIEIRPAGVSPVRDVYDFVELEAKDGDTLLFIKGKKDSEDPRFARISDYATKVNKNINKDFINIDDIKSRSGKPVSGTSMRSYIKNNDKKSFIDGLPEETDEAAAWNTVTNLDEDLYNPEDKVLDYMKSSEFKAGYTKKDDVPPGYKYRRGGQYSAASGQGGAGTMYEADEKGKTLHAYDFDDTIAQVKANIRTTITSPSGDYNKEILIPAANFPEESKELEARLGSLEIKYDFSEFEKQINDAIVNSKVINKLKSSLSNPQIKTTILTARSIGHPVTRYLKSIGLDAYVVPLGLQVDGKVTGQDKANWIENHIKKGYQTIYFIDDSEENRTAVAALKDKYPDISLTVEDPAAVNEINEGPQFGVLYHFTQELSQVLGDNTLRGPVSLTRSLDSHVTQWLGDQPYFIFDKDKLRTKYKITPFKDTSDNPDYEPISQYDEMEEVIENDITNLARYTIKVVLPYSDENWENALKEKNIPYEVKALDEMMGTMNNQEKAKHAKNLKRLKKDTAKQGDQYMEVPKYIKGTLTRKLYEKMSASDVDAVEDFADKKLDPVDVDLTSDHFFDRLNDPRNKKEISGAELIGFFKRLSKRKKEFIEFLKQYKELVVTDDRTNINIPFMKLANKVIAKTVMRKPDFQTSSPSLTLEKVTKDKVICDNCGWDWEIDDGGDDVYMCHKCDHDNTPTNENYPPYKANQVQQTRYKASDVFTRDVKKAEKMGYKENAFTKDWWKQQIVEVLTETKANTHLTHLEELVLTQGQDGYNQAKSFLYELIKNLKGEDNTIKNVSVKWDGAPAIFTGINPNNGKFFVGTKSVFNVNPKINYTSQDIDTNHGHAAGLAKKLKLALQYLPAVGIKGILQGDFMFDSDDVKTEDIEGVSHYTFKPNTIRYAVEANSKIGKKILEAKIGIIFHTTYKDLSGGGASFGADISGLSESSNVWFDDAYFKDDTGILLNDKEEAFVSEKIKEADSLKVDYSALPDEISSRAKTNLLNTYLNQEIRKGEFINDPSKSFETFVNWYKEKIEKAVAKISPKNQDKKRAALTDKLKTFIGAKDNVINLFKVSKLLSQAKNIFIAKYDKAVATKHFIDNGDGTLSVTKAEGFVAVDHTESGIKLVDRLEFSKNNFNAGKPGEKK